MDNSLDKMFSACQTKSVINSDGSDFGSESRSARTSKESFMGMFTEALKDGLGAGEKFKLAEGENQVRVLSEPRMVESTFKGNLNRKWLAWIIERKDGVTKLFYMPKTIVSHLADIESMKFYAFDAPRMPYDVIIKAKHAGTIDAEYTVIASPKQEPLTADELEQVKTLKRIDEVVSKLMERQAGMVDEPAVHNAA